MRMLRSIATYNLQCIGQNLSHSSRDSGEPSKPEMIVEDRQAAVKRKDMVAGSL